ncbi:MAG TPA: cell division regulator GpsB [Firmicutes bacterium]|nr:cell division regulator GpsB [Bacillota bacterium]
MYDVEIKLSPKEILNKEFKFDAKGYRPKEVDEYLDTVISDYTEFIRLIKKLENDNKVLQEENIELKSELRKTKELLETQESSSNKSSSNNVDLLRRLSNLEKIVYGKNE